MSSNTCLEEGRGPTVMSSQGMLQEMPQEIAQEIVQEMLQEMLC